MKTKLGVLLIIVMLLSLIPASAFAAAPAELDLRVYNRTSSPVTVKLTASDGALTWLDLPVGVSTITLTEGIYEYYAVTACGTQVGKWNVNVVKELLIKCDMEMPVITLQRACPDNFYGHYWLSTDTGWLWFIYWDDVNGPDVLGEDMLDLGIGCWSDKADFGW